MSMMHRFVRHWPDLDSAIDPLFFQGVSTIRLRSIAQELFGCGVSVTTVSRNAVYLDYELKPYQTGLLADNYPFLFLDGIAKKLMKIGVKKRMMLCALGMKEKQSGDSLVPTGRPRTCRNLA